MEDQTGEQLSHIQIDTLKQNKGTEVALPSSILLSSHYAATLLHEAIEAPK